MVRNALSPGSPALLLAICDFSGGSADLQIAEEERRRLCHIGYGTVENLLVVDRRPLEPTHLADVLEGGGLDLLGWSRDRPVTQAFD